MANEVIFQTKLGDDAELRVYQDKGVLIDSPQGAAVLSAQQALDLCESLDLCKALDLFKAQALLPPPYPSVLARSALSSRTHLLAFSDGTIMINSAAREVVVLDTAEASNLRDALDSALVEIAPSEDAINE